MKTWIAVVNRSGAKIFEVNEKNGVSDQKLKLVKKVENPKGRLRSREINADRPGIAKVSFTFAYGTRMKKQNPTERVAQDFARQIAEDLEIGYKDHLYESLILVVEPHFLGKMRAALSKKTTNVIKRTIHKDLVNVPDHDLPRFIWPKTEESQSSSFALNP